MGSIAAELKIDRGALKNVVDYLCTLIAAHNFVEYANTMDLIYVEADETAVGQRKYHRGARRRIDGTLWVAGFVGVSREGVDCMFAHVVNDRKRASLLPPIEHVIQDAVDPVVVTDCWRGYNGIDAGKRTCQHECVNHSEEFVSRHGFHTQHIECMWRQMKNQVRKRWSNIGSADLLGTNARVQVGVFFSIVSVLNKNPFQELLKLVRNGKALSTLHKEIVDIQKDISDSEAASATAADVAPLVDPLEAAIQQTRSNQQLQAHVKEFAPSLKRSTKEVPPPPIEQTPELAAPPASPLEGPPPSSALQQVKTEISVGRKRGREDDTPDASGRKKEFVRTELRGQTQIWLGCKENHICHCTVMTPMARKAVVVLTRHNNEPKSVSLKELSSLPALPLANEGALP